MPLSRRSSPASPWPSTPTRSTPRLPGRTGRRIPPTGKPTRGEVELHRSHRRTDQPSASSVKQYSPDTPGSDAPPNRRSGPLGDGPKGGHRQTVHAANCDEPRLRSFIGGWARSESLVGSTMSDRRHARILSVPSRGGFDRCGIGQWQHGAESDLVGALPRRNAHSARHHAVWPVGVIASPTHGPPMVHDTEGKAEIHHAPLVVGASWVLGRAAPIRGMPIPAPFEDVPGHVV